MPHSSWSWLRTSAKKHPQSVSLDSTSGSATGSRSTEVEAQPCLEVAKVEVARKSQANIEAEKSRAEVKEEKANANAKGVGWVKKASGSMILQGN